MHWFGLVFTSVAYILPYQQLAAMAKPSYGDDGELIDGGYDMSTAGVCGYHFHFVFIFRAALIRKDFDVNSICLPCGFLVEIWSDCVLKNPCSFKLGCYSKRNSL